MGSVTRRSLAALLAVAPAVAAVVALPGAVATAVPYAPAQAGETKVAAGSLKFNPAEVTVGVGGKVTWTNADGVYHTVTGGEPPSTVDPASPIGNGTLDTMGKTYSVTFAKAGTFKYFCQPHAGQGMVGTVTVTAGGAATATAAPSTAAPTTAAPAGSSAPPASASASASVGAPQQGAGAPTGEPKEGEGHDSVPGVKDNKTLELIEAAREEQAGAVSGFRFFAAVATAFLFILGAAVMFSTRPRRAGR